MLYSRDKRLQLRSTKEFSKTNKPWNDLRLNSKWNIGCLMFIAKESKANTFNEWENYYLNSGLIRKELLLSKRYDKEQMIRINSEYGRTKDDLIQIAKTLSRNLNISLTLAYNYVYIRVIDETWIGLNRELTGLQIIQNECQKYGDFSVHPVDYNFDIKYAVDFEIKDNHTNSVILAVQLKSVKYKNSNLDGVLDIKSINIKKNADYKKKFNTEVLYLYMDKYKIMNLNELSNLLDSYTAAKEFI